MIEKIPTLHGVISGEQLKTLSVPALFIRKQ